MKRRFGLQHRRGEYVNGEAHTNNIENFWSQLKRGIIGVYRVVSPEHLQFYVDEFVFRRNTCKFVPKERFLHLLSNTKGYRLTYKDLKKCRLR